MKKTVIVSLLTVFLFALALTPVLAQPTLDTGLGTTKGITGYQESDLVETVARIIKLVLGFLGLIALILFIVGGFKWMTSGGNEENISEAKKLMSAAIVGLFIIIIAYAATIFIVNKLTEVSGQACQTNQVKCANANPGQYVTCQNNQWGTVVGNCAAGQVCILGNVAANATTLCQTQ